MVPEWMGKEGDEKEIWSRKGREGAFSLQAWLGKQHGRQEARHKAAFMLRCSPLSSCFRDYTSAQPDVVF